MLQNKNVVTVIILILVTCGIYNLIWVWQTAQALHEQGKNSLVDPIVQFILYLLTAYIGWIIFAIPRRAKAILQGKKNIPRRCRLPV